MSATTPQGKERFLTLHPCRKLVTAYDVQLVSDFAPDNPAEEGLKLLTLSRAMYSQSLLTRLVYKRTCIVIGHMDSNRAHG
jgi:hypothetical protein